MVQLGNEIIGGFLWPEGRVGGSYNTTQQWTQFTSLLKEAHRAVDDALPDTSIPVMIHIDRGGDNSGSRWFYDNLNNYNVSFDFIGLSFYPWWHGTLTQLSQNLNDLAGRYNKNIIVVETAYPWTLQWDDNVNNLVGNNSQLHTGYPATTQGQYNFLKDIITIVKNTPGNRGKGLFYWAPEWISVPPLGSSWENLALFSFSNHTLFSIAAFHDSSTSVLVEEEEPISEFRLHQNYPNPFNPVTRIDYEIDKEDFVRIVIYNSLGEEVYVLVNDFKTAGKHFVEWNGRDSRNNFISSGIYVVKFTSGGKSALIKTILLK
jgi:arabinogalactan endo-1,4-beta-galactosidase